MSLLSPSDIQDPNLLQCPRHPLRGHSHVCETIPPARPRLTTQAGPRRAGSDLFIELHLELDGRLNLEQAHAITHEVEGRIRAAYPAADITVHQEPAGLADERLDAQIAAAER